MFRNVSKSRRSKKVLDRPLLSLATKDREWSVSTNDDTPLVDVANKQVNFSKLGKNYNVEYALSVIEAKHYPDNIECEDDLRKYVDLVRKLCVYWYYEKKAREKLNGVHHEQYVVNQKYPSLFYSGTYEKAKLFARRWWITAFKHARNNGAKYELAREIVSNPYLLFGSIYSQEIMRDIQDIFMNETVFANEKLARKDAEYSYRQLRNVHGAVYDAWYDIKRTRKDAFIVPKQRIIGVAEVLRSKLSDNFDLVMPSVKFEKMMKEYTGDDVIDIVDEHGVLTQSTDYLNMKMMENLERVEADQLRSTNEKLIFSGWGKMKIQKVPFKQSLPIKVMGRSRTFSDRGVHPRSMNRWATDKKVFTRRVKQRGGTVLIDVSGSMSLSNYDIEKLVRLLPASTIAMYSGTVDGYSWDNLKEYKGSYTYPTPDNYTGELHILAEKGKWVGDIPRHAGENIVDGPAIDWLSTQAQPRILVSDLQVSGIDFTQHDDEERYYACSNFDGQFGLDAMKKIKMGGIIPIKDIHTAIEWVEKS